jgi:hypothetical protein
MSTLVDEAVEVLRQLPDDLQNVIARSILAYSHENEAVL